MIIKQRALALRHTPRVQRVDLDFLFHIFRQDPSICIRYVNTKCQIADILTKGLFTAIQWTALCELIQLQDARTGKLTPPKAKTKTSPKTPAQNNNTQPYGDNTTKRSNTTLGHGSANLGRRNDRQGRSNKPLGQRPSEPNCRDALLPNHVIDISSLLKLSLIHI